MDEGHDNGRTRAVVLCAVALLALVFPMRARAIPVFAHRYGVTCQQCHTTIPHLNGFGLQFFRNGFRMPTAVPGERPEPSVAVATNLAYTSEPDPTGLPKAIVDEVELLTGGSAGRVSYFGDFYIVDGGRHGSPRDAWVSYWFPSKNDARLRIRAGTMTLPLPVDPETFRETENHYAVYDQSVGSNPFNFFDVHSGAEVAFGNPTRGLDARILFLRPHDPHALLPEQGTDTMAYLQWLVDGTSVSAYEYRGTRLVGGPADSFVRYGIGASRSFGKFEADALLQNGRDTNADGSGTLVRASGGFVQLRWEFSRALAALVRYDGTDDTSAGSFRSLTFTVNRRVARNARLTLEDVVTHVPATKHTFNAGLMFAY